MSIWLRWDDNNKTILHQVFEEGWTLQAYYHSIAALEAMVADQPQSVRLVMDLSNASKMPLRSPRGRRIDEALATRNVERVILINPGYFMPVVKCPIDVVDSWDEALALLAGHSLKVSA